MEGRCFLEECTEENELNMHKWTVSSQMSIKKAKKAKFSNLH